MSFPRKRGLPHAHILLIFTKCKDNQLSTTLIDELVSAEYPSKPLRTHFSDGNAGTCYFEDAVRTYERACQLIDLFMLHGPCGDENPSAPCCSSGKCKKHFPKEFQKSTLWSRDNNYPLYRRTAPQDIKNLREVKIGRGTYKRKVDNSWIVPHNLWLLLKYVLRHYIILCYV
jgi:hypothetical protein